MEKKNKIDELLKDHHDLITALKMNKRFDDPKFKLAWEEKSKDVKDRIESLNAKEHKEWQILHREWLKNNNENTNIIRSTY